MAIYPDLYIRSRLDDPGTVPRSTAGISDSPDVIPFGVKPAVNPVPFFTGNFNQDVGVEVFATAPNFLYLRGRNQFDGAQTGKAWIYWAPSNLLLWPSIWRNNIMQTPNEQGSIDVSAAKKGDPWVTPDPFVWVPALPQPGVHYCLVGRVATKEHPNEIPSVGNIPDFAEWIAANGGLGWHNVATVDARVTFTLAQGYQQGDLGDEMLFNLICTGAPVGSEVSLASGTNLPDGQPVYIPPMRITQPGGQTQIFGVSADIPSNWSTTFYMTYKSNGGMPYPNFDISLRVLFAVTEANEKLYTMASTLEELGYGDMLMYSREKKNSWFPAAELHESGAVRLIVLGGVGAHHKES